jgi:hypothetical protein
MGVSKCTVLIVRTGSDTVSSIRDRPEFISHSMRRIELISILTNTLDGVVRAGLFRPMFIVIRIDTVFSERVDDCGGFEIFSQNRFSRIIYVFRTAQWKGTIVYFITV